jgi:hypothetical protein
LSWLESPSGPRPPYFSHFEIILRHSHSDTPHSVGLLWTSEWSVGKTSTWQHIILARDRYPNLGGIRTRNPSKLAAADPHLRPHGYGDRHTTIYWREISIYLINIWKNFVSEIQKEICWALSGFSYSAVFLNMPNFPRPPLICYAYCTLMALTCCRCKLKYSLTWRFRKTYSVQDQPTIILICCQIAFFQSKTYGNG